MNNLLLAVSVLDLLLPRPASVVSDIGAAGPKALSRVVEKKGDVGAPGGLDESYRLEITSGGVTLTAFTAGGFRYGRTTLEQLKALGGEDGVPCCTITDWPRLKWRGLLLDCGRNWADLSLVRDIIDMLAKYKMNVFHWHLSDNYGWRLESKRYPQLQRTEAFERQAGRFCTQAEFKEMVEYAAQRGVRIVPEIDMPGHSLAFRKAFGLKKMHSPGVDQILCDLIDELCSLEPADRMPVIHIGTDEVREDSEKVPDAWYALWASRVTANGRTVMGWHPGHKLDVPGPVYQETWYETRPPTGPYVDATCYYIDSFDPAGLLAQAAFKRPCPYPVDPGFRLGGEIQAWHDDPVADGNELVRDNPLFAAIVQFSDSFWNDRAANRTDLIFRPPSPDRPEFAQLVDLERRVLAQRDRVLKGFRHPLHLVGQTHMRWRIEDKEGTVLARDIPSGVVYVHAARHEWGYASFVDAPTGTVTLVGRFVSSEDRAAGALVELNAFHRSGARIFGTPKQGEWNRYGATVTLNGKKVLPPTWNLPDRRDGMDACPWTDESAWIRPFTPIDIRKGENEVRIVLPKTDTTGYWSATFIPVTGEVGHPREIPDLRWL